jgi:hypothetical protein
MIYKMRVDCIMGENTLGGPFQMFLMKSHESNFSIVIEMVQSIHIQYMTKGVIILISTIINRNHYLIF